MRYAALLFAALASTSVCAQQKTYWPAEAILGKTNSPNVNLYAGAVTSGNKVDTVQRIWVERAVDATRKLSNHFGMNMPFVFITNDAAPNAFVVMNNDGLPTMVINTEMLRLTGDDEAEMAVVIGHELGHLKANHLSEGRARQGLVTLIGILAGAAVDIHQAKRGIDTQGLGTQLGSVGGDLANAKFSRDQEREADELGLRAMVSAGFDPGAAPRLWRLMAARTNGGSGFWLDSHPSHVERERSLQTLASTLSPTSADDISRVALIDPYPPTRRPGFTLTNEEQSAVIPSAYRIGLEAQNAGRYTDAIAAFDQAVEIENDERAMVQLAIIYTVGKSAPNDLIKATALLNRAASLGFPAAILFLGEHAQFGTGRAIDLAEAVRFYSIALQRSVPRAAARLSLMYFQGQGGLSKDLVKARQLAQAASDKNDVFGTAILGAYLRDGAGGAMDKSKGLALLQSVVSGKQELPYAHFQLAWSYEHGAGTLADKDLAAAEYRKAFAGGVTSARDRLQAMGLAP